VPKLPPVSVGLKENREWNFGGFGGDKLKKLVRVNNRMLRDSGYLQESFPIKI